LDMKEVDTEKYGDLLNFTLTVLTSSENRNEYVFIKTLKIAREADIALTGKCSQQSYSYGNITYGKSNFTQIYQVEKFGASPIDEVFLSVQIPTQIYGEHGTELINVVQLYAPDGIHAKQPINCQSNTQYIVENILSSESEMGLQDARNTVEDDIMTTELPLLKRSVREIKQEDTLTNETKIESEYPANRTFYINCSNSDVVCSYIHCSIGPFRIKQNIAVLRIKMVIDVSSISTLLGNKDVVILSTDGMVSIKSPSNFIQSGIRPDSVKVSSIFVGKIPESEVETWIIIVAIIAGLLLLLLVIMGLTKAGFFQRKKKIELEALKEASKEEEVEQFKRDSVSCQETDENTEKESTP